LFSDPLGEQVVATAAAYELVRARDLKTKKTSRLPGFL
jgi:hypothetical protein